ncbi:MAG: DNA methyltransferase, partial [Nitrososphaerota archaeon]|nr:DNA methyltransferase [Nitrososphaerota archaeon]
MGDMAMMPEKFGVVYADPPWMYKRGGNGRAAAHYPLMTTVDICSLPVNELTAEDAALFLWTTFPCYPNALQVALAWGFQYKSVAFTWIKPNRKSKGWALGTGYWLRANAEICIFATKGNPKRKKRNVPQLIVEPRREHSRKPDTASKRIVELFGDDMPKVEL